VIRGRRLAATILWYLVPVLAVGAVVAYILGATIGGANPPLVPVVGTSMRPTLLAGDLVFVRGVDPNKLRKGDVIAFHVPADARQKYGIPANIVHRIIGISRDADGNRVFQTKGDANAGPDAFTVPAGNVVGKEYMSIRGLGYPFLFFSSNQGKIFAAAAALIALIYFGLGLFDERRAMAADTAMTMQAVYAETHELRQAIATAKAVGTTVDTLELRAPGASVAIDRLVDEVHESTARSEDTHDTMRQLVGAIGEYGEHLRSHTEVMKNLAATTAELRQAVAELRSASAERSAGEVRDQAQREAELIVADARTELRRIAAEIEAEVDARLRAAFEALRRPPTA
jgi:signal peptidase